MKPLAVMDQRPADRAGGSPRGESRPFGFAKWAFASNTRARASQTFAGNDAKDSRNDSYAIPSRILKPNIYYKAQDFTLGAHRAPGCRGANRANCHLSGTAGEESEPAGPGVNARPGPTETSSAPDRPAHLGFSFDEPVAGMAEDAACDC